MISILASGPNYSGIDYQRSLKLFRGKIVNVVKVYQLPFLEESGNVD